jgi:hypothetical protein
MVGTATLALIDSFNRNRSRLQPVPIKEGRNRSVGHTTELAPY